MFIAVVTSPSWLLQVLLFRLPSRTSQAADAFLVNRLPLDQLLGSLGDSVGIDNCLPVSLSNGDMVAVRKCEIAAAISRLRKGVTVQPLT